MKRKILIFMLLALSGIAIACTTKSMPFLGVIDVSLRDMVSAYIEDYKNPARAAMLNNLDERAARVVGADNWKSNNYVGHVTYNTPLGGQNIVYTEKPCDEDAVDSAPKEGDSGGGGSDAGAASDGGNDYWGYVNAWSMSQNWGTNYDNLYGNVGIPTVAP